MPRFGIVSDSSPLIFLSAVSDLHLLRSIFASVAIPRAVWREVVVEGRNLPGAAEVEQASREWLGVVDVANTARVAEIAREQRLQPGESEAIALAEENLLPVLLDEQRAVSYARSRGTRTVRTPMIYAKAKSLGLIPSVRDRLDVLRQRRFFLKDRDYDAILKIVGEF